MEIIIEMAKTEYVYFSIDEMLKVFKKIDGGGGINEKSK